MSLPHRQAEPRRSDPLGSLAQPLQRGWFAGVFLLAALLTTGLLCSQPAAVSGGAALRVEPLEISYLQRQAVVNVYLQRAGVGNYLQLSLDFDTSQLRLDGFSMVSSVWQEAHDRRFSVTRSGRLQGVLRRVSDVAATSTSDELSVLSLRFTLLTPSEPYPGLLVDQAPVFFTPYSADAEPRQDLRDRSSLAREGSRPGRDVGQGGDDNAGDPLLDWIPTSLVDGGLTIHYQNGVELGSGGITKRSQSFALPLYLTHLDSFETVSVGIDYDELILLKRVIPMSPPMHESRDEVAIRYLPLEVPEGDEDDVARQSARFTLNAALDDQGRCVACPLIRVHVADLVFEYTEDPAGRSPDELHITPELLGSGAEVAEDGGGGTTQSVPGRVRFIEPHFVRGNVDSSHDVCGEYQHEAMAFGPEISDAVAILEGVIFYGPHVIPCLEAADVNGNTRLELADAVTLLSYLFRGGHPPAAPFPEPGISDPASRLDCRVPLPYFVPLADR